MGVWMGPRSSKFKNADDFTFTGNSSFLSDSSGNWEIVLKSSGAFTFKKDPGTVDLFYVGGGHPGEPGSVPTSNIEARGGSGGSGGKIRTEIFRLRRGVSYPITIGEGGYYTGSVKIAPTESQGFGSSSASGASAAATGGRGSITRASDRYQSSVGGSPGVNAFADVNTLYQPGYKYGASGGGAQSMYEYTYNSDGSQTGGTDGGGDGGWISSRQSTGKGEDGAENSGSGGGGGWAAYTATYGAETGQPGKGGSGIIIIRNHRA